MGKINWNLIKEYKTDIKDFKKRNGTQRAIYFVQGILGLKYGELTKYNERIRKEIKKL